MATRGSQCITPKTYQLEDKSEVIDGRDREEERDNVILYNAHSVFCS